MDGIFNGKERKWLNWTNLYNSRKKGLSTKLCLCSPIENDEHTDFVLQMPKQIQTDIVGQFSAVLRGLIIFSNLFGIMPLCNVFLKRERTLYFTWHSLGFIYSLFVLLSIFALFCISFYKQFVFQVQYEKFSKYIFALIFGQLFVTR